VVDIGRKLERIDRELDIHVALDLAAAGRVDELLGRLRHDAVAVVVEPVDERADRRVFLVFDERRVVKGAHQMARDPGIP
jgi:hypothetical protein